MAQIKRPQHDQSVTPQTRGGSHPRETDGKNPDRTLPRQSGEPVGQDASREPGERKGFGKHIDSPDVPRGADDLDRNPSIGSSKGTSQGGDALGDVEDEGSANP